MSAMNASTAARRSFALSSTSGLTLMPTVPAPSALRPPSGSGSFHVMSVNAGSQLSMAGSPAACSASKVMDSRATIRS